MNNKVTMKLGYIGFVCTPPKEITEPLAYLKWQVDRLTEMGGSVLHVASRLPADEESRQSLKEYIDSRQVQFEFGGIREIFGLAGPNASEIRESILAKIRTARFFEPARSCAKDMAACLSKPPVSIGQLAGPAASAAPDRQSERSSPDL